MDNILYNLALLLYAAIGANFYLTSDWCDFSDPFDMLRCLGFSFFWPILIFIYWYLERGKQ